ncbi:MAG: diphthine--ammonia ligase, partial [Flammeovirgaceae bacterium]
MKRFLPSWSGGKDSGYALMLAKSTGFQPVALLNILNEQSQLSRSHGIPKEIIEKQAALLGLPIYCPSASWETYEDVFISGLKKLKEQVGFDSAVFGDIDLQAHRDWEEKVCQEAKVKPLLPLWQQNRKAIVEEMLLAGMEAYIVSCNETMGPSFLGRQITLELVQELEILGVDPCGENGEYHTLVVNMPLFSARLDVIFGTAKQHNAYWFVDMRLAYP